MKIAAVKSMLLVLSILFGSFFSLTSNAQSKTSTSKVYAIINKADWCPACKANGGRVMNEVIPACKDLNVQFLPNDLTNAQTTEKSAKALKNNNVYSSIKDIKTTGVILLVDAKTKKVIKQISVTLATNEIVKEITAAQG